MGRSKSVDTPAAQARRMPFVAKIKREYPFRPNDAQEINGMCRRIAASSEYQRRVGWREDAGFLVYRFTTWAKARAMQYWIDRTGIAKRPMPKLGVTPEEITETKERALTWGLATGAVREVVQAYRRARHAGDAELTSFNAACTVAMALGRPTGEVENTVKTLLEWAKENHREWFYRFESPAAPSRKTIHSAPAESPTAPDAEPLPPRHSPRF
jgi:hypothetical protein